MSLSFYKYQGTSNDFIMIDDRQNKFDLNNHELVRSLCNRKFGIGADGLILVREHPSLDFEMIYFNSDASRSLCGNGSRCVVDFARYLDIVDEKCHFQAYDGEHFAFIEDGVVHLKMNDVSELKPIGDDLFINTGSPHYIKFVDELETLDVVTEARKIRYNPTFKDQGVNVNFVQIKDEHQVLVRTYERGVENETLSCGTGVTAVSLALSFKNQQSPLKISTPGGQLTVTFNKNPDHTFSDIFLIGPVEMVFKGSI